MFKDIIEYLNKCEYTIKDLDKRCPPSLTEEEKDVMNYFELYFAKMLMQNRFINSEKVAKIILATKGLSGEISVKIK